jgi:hypothetical protein
VTSCPTSSIKPHRTVSATSLISSPVGPELFTRLFVYWYDATKVLGDTSGGLRPPAPQLLSVAVQTLRYGNFDVG